MKLYLFCLVLTWLYSGYVLLILLNLPRAVLGRKSQNLNAGLSFSTHRDIEKLVPDRDEFFIWVSMNEHLLNRLFIKAQRSKTHLIKVILLNIQSYIMEFSMCVSKITPFCIPEFFACKPEIIVSFIAIL